MSLLRTILILIIIYYVVQLFTRYIFPVLFRNYVHSKVNEFENRQKKQQRKATRKEGEVTIDHSPEQKRKDKLSKGEYIDYEEIKD